MYKSGETVSFKYNADGLRVQKVATSTGTTNYTLHGKNIVHMTQGGNTLHFFYDANNKPAIVEYNGTKYAYVHNLQGDIVAILDSAGTKVVEYKYDAWGRPISKTGTMANTLGKINPFRYRGYVYDEETGLYYLRSRYYQATQSRFLNEDSIISGNLFAYCNNCPVSRSDMNGRESLPNSTEWINGMPTCIDMSVYEHMYEVEAQIQAYSNDQKNNSNASAPYVTVSVLLSRFDNFISKRTNFRSKKDSGCASFIRGGILNKYGPHSSHVYAAGATTMFRDDVIVKGCIDDIGGPDSLMVGMILGTPMDGEFSDGKYHVEHVGVYAGMIEYENKLVHGVYSFNTDTNRGNLIPYERNEWKYYAWHKGIVMD